MWGLYVEHIISTWEHMCTVWHVCLVNGICQQCKMYVCQSLCSHCWLHWVDMRHIYWHSCALCGHELIGMYGLYVSFEGHIKFCHVYGSNRMPMVPSVRLLHLLWWDDCLEVLYDLYFWCYYQYLCKYHVPLTMPLMSCDANVNGVTSPQKSCCICMWLFWPKKYKDVINDTLDIMWCQCQWHHMTSKVMLHLISVFLM